MDESCMQEYRRDKAPPLIRLMAAVRKLCDRGLVWDAAHTTKFAEGAFGVYNGSVGTWPGGDVVLDDGADVVHAGGEAAAHVDQDVIGGADHDVEGGFRLNGRAC